ncbi:PQQ-like beta-propeller repeat protein [Micromonospora phytophila]|uniref:outer membrane protein assembly factor BamB family protein n=1 Tax=Micromonospora phytophila TaxID=709888 RepID=UPI0020303DB2|nr:PQQ-binding-like beta-propeller repeat protein [Micromonospora phytophila]MCM0678432.1 PQQ-like beta-propeller repeat protein [Micromonospora phytophila]
MVVIDLGELRDDTGNGPPGRRPPRATGRAVRSVAALLLALVTLAGAALQPERTAAAVPARPGAEAHLVGDRLFVVEPADADVDGSRQLVAYALPEASGALAPLWRTPVPGDGPFHSTLVRAGLVLLSAPATGDGRYQTSAFELATGRWRWQQPGFPVADVDDDVLLFVDSDASQPGTVRAVELPTGRARWSVPVPPEGADLRLGGEFTDGIVLVPSPGQVEVWDAGSGVKLRSAKFRPDELSSSRRMQVVDDLLLAIDNNATTVTAYGLEGLDHRWSARLSLVTGLSSCGDLLCAYGQSGGMWALDPATGRTRWSDRRWWWTAAESGGRLLVGTPGAGDAATLAVVEAATGRVTAELGSWELVGWRHGEHDGPLIGVRRSPDGRLLVAQLDVAAARVELLDVLVDASGACQAGGDVLLCRRTDGAFGLWRLDR